MQLNELRLRNFRNYEEAEFAFAPGVNLILGENAQGKTNLLEAIFFLSAGHGFRTRKEMELLRFGADFAEIEGRITSQQRERTLRTVLFAGKRPRQLFSGGVKAKGFADLRGVLLTVLFCPEDLMVLRAGGAQRRKLLDTALCQLRPGYERALAEYNRLLEQKSRILKDWREQPGLVHLLPDYNLRMAQVGAILIGYRANYLEKLDRCTGAFHREFSGGAEQLEIFYKTVSTIIDPKAGKQELEQAILEHQATHERAELESGQCLTGPHKDDFDLVLDGVSLKSFGSQGQTRTAAISLKLAERQIIQEDTGENPVLLLDDVLSELDTKRQDFVLNKISSGQVFISCCETDKLTSIGKTIVIRQGSVVKECP